MPSPLVKLMTYGGTPINRQADRFLSHRARKRHGRKKSGATTKESASSKRVCPICGKRKKGPEAHMTAKHGGATIPQSLDRFVNLVFGKGKPAQNPPSAVKTPIKDEIAKPRPSGQGQMSKTTGKMKRHCPICDAQFTRLAQHVSQAHDQLLTECPSCYAEIIVKGAGKKRCSECRKVFTIEKKGKAAGIRVECPNCFNDFYTEKLGLIQCPTCKTKTCFDGRGKPC